MALTGQIYVQCDHGMAVTGSTSHSLCENCLAWLLQYRFTCSVTMAWQLQGLHGCYDSSWLLQGLHPALFIKMALHGSYGTDLHYVQCDHGMAVTGSTWLLRGLRPALFVKVALHGSYGTDLHYMQCDHGMAVTGSTWLLRFFMAVTGSTSCSFCKKWSCTALMGQTYSIV